MHIVLQSPDLLLEIFQHLQLEHDQKSCLNGALTCRGFRNPAQDALWRDLRCGILPLVKLLSNLQCTTDDDVKTYSLQGPINPVDLERMRYFGSRVHSLTCTERGSTGYIIDLVYEEIASALDDSLLTPNLENLSWDLFGDSTSILGLLHSPRLKQIEITSNSAPAIEASWEGDIYNFIQRLADEKVQLSTLMLNLPCDDRLVNLIPSSFTHLRSLQFGIATDSVTPIHYPFLHSLTEFKNLETLFLDVASFDLNLTGQLYPDLCFPHVSTLGFTCAFHEALKFLSMSKFPSLSSFHLDFVIPSMIQFPVSGTWHYDWPRLLALLHDISAPSQISNLVIKPWRRSWSDNDDDIEAFMAVYPGIMFEDVSEHLFRFNLSELSFQFPLFKSLTMDNLQDIAVAWPQLRIMHLYCSTETTVALEALHFIAANLPDLISLSLSMDAAFDSVEIDLPEQSTHKLEVLNLQLAFYAENGDEALQLASHIDALFPRLRVFGEMDATFALKDGQGSRDESLLTQLLDFVQSARRRERRIHGIRDYKWVSGKKQYVV